MHEVATLLDEEVSHPCKLRVGPDLQNEHVTFAEHVVRSARHTVRLLRTHPGFVLTVVLSLALGIGANTTIFSVVHGVLIQPLPYPHADALVGIDIATIEAARRG